MNEALINDDRFFAAITARTTPSAPFAWWRHSSRQTRSRVRCWQKYTRPAGTLAAMIGLANLAIRGFAPGGTPALLTLAVYACGVVLTVCSGRPDDVVSSSRVVAAVRRC